MPILYSKPQIITIQPLENLIPELCAGCHVASPSMGVHTVKYTCGIQKWQLLPRNYGPQNRFKRQFCKLIELKLKVPIRIKSKLMLLYPLSLRIGAAIVVAVQPTPQSFSLIFNNNQCFLTYEDHDIPPNQWDNVQSELYITNSACSCINIVK